jgi:hypothetical protein
VAGSASPPEDQLSALFTRPPTEFVAARDRLASELRRQGRKDDAAAVKALTRPSPSAFAVNQLARRAPRDLTRLEEATHALERTQGGDAGAEGRRAYRQALAEQREALDVLVEQARLALDEAGMNAGRAVLDRVASNLRSAMLDPQARELVRRGRLVHDIAAPDLSSLLERFPAPGERAAREEPPPKPPSAPHPGHAAASRHEEKSAARQREKVDAIRARRRGVDAEVARHRDEVAAAHEAQRRAEEQVAALRRQLADQEREAAAATRAEAAAKRALDQALAALAKLDAELARAER